MDAKGFAAYGLLLAAGAACARLGRLARVPGAALALAAGLAAGRAGFGVVSARGLEILLPGVLLHVGVLLGVLGYRLGQGMLRLPPATIARRSLPPLLLAAASLAAGAALLPLLLPGAAPERSFVRFALPLAFVFAVYPLLALRDLRGRPPADAGSLFLVAVALVGAVTSFTPQLLWSHADPGVIWRGPLLVLGESGALGVAGGVAALGLSRRMGLPRAGVAFLVLAGAAELAFRLRLWPPFAALGFGAVLGRAGERAWRLPRAAGVLFSEAPFALLLGGVFAPDLFRESVAGPALLNAVALAAFVLVVRRVVPGGRELVTGPGLLFLGLTLAVRLDRRMGPINRYTVDFALPAWVLLRAVLAVVERGRRTAGG